MSYIKTVIIFVLTLSTAQSFADDTRDCFEKIMIDEGIADMQNKFNPNTIAGKAAIKIWNHCKGLHNSSFNGSLPFNKPADKVNPDIETLECTPETCSIIEESTDVEI